MQTIVLALILSHAAARPHPYSTLKLPARAPLPPLARALPPPRASTWCTPAQPCWPTPAQWAAFNASLGGALIAVAPPLAPCFGFPGVPRDAARCAAARLNFTNSYWRAAQPGASQDVAWEQDQATGESCLDPAQPCALGNIPPLAVAAAGSAHVALALAFAAQHTLQVVVKSTGHEYQGRSAGAHALLVWTHALRGLDLDPAFSACAGAPPAPAITVSPGTSWGEAYAAADAARVNVVGGSEISVSACGGYTLGGGHSWMGPALGMAVDNALRFTAVLANGTEVSASACENADLFWALRGGGGSALGVLTSCTYATHPFPPAGATGAFITIELLQGSASFAVLLEGWLAGVGALGSGPTVAGGYFIPTFDAPEGTHEHVSFLLGINGTVAQASALLAPLKAFVEAQPTHLSIIGADLEPYPSLMQFHEAYDASSEPMGYAGTLGSRVLPLALLNNATSRAALVRSLTTIAYTVGMTGQLVAGGAVAAADPRLTSLNPAWRSAGVHVSFGAAWPLNATQAEREAVFGGVSALTELLRGDAPGSAAYFSESDFLEPSWEEAFWGPNYQRLQQVKRAVDPAGLLSCHHCVEL